MRVRSGVPTAPDAAALTWTTRSSRRPCGSTPRRRSSGAARCTPTASASTTSRRAPRWWSRPGSPTATPGSGTSQSGSARALRARGRRGRHRYAWFPFGGGHAACIGQTLSLLEGVIALAVLVRDFDFTTPPGRVAYTTEITLRPAGGLPSLVTARSAV